VNQYPQYPHRPRSMWQRFKALSTVAKTTIGVAVAITALVGAWVTISIAGFLFGLGGGGSSAPSNPSYHAGLQTGHQFSGFTPVDEHRFCSTNFDAQNEFGPNSGHLNESEFMRGCYDGISPSVESARKRPRS
jgi:hypothetical protein